MFEKIGRKLIRGAKAEMTEKPLIDEETLDRIIEGGLKLLGLGVLLLCVLTGNKESKTATTVVNNYIYIKKED